MPIRIPGQAGDPDFLFPYAPALYFPRRVWYNNNSRKYERGRRDVQPYLSGNYELLQSLVCLLPRDAAGAADAPGRGVSAPRGEAAAVDGLSVSARFGRAAAAPAARGDPRQRGGAGLSRLSGDERDAARAASRSTASRPTTRPCRWRRISPRFGTAARGSRSAACSARCGSGTRAGWRRRTRRSSAIWSGAADGASRTSPPTGAGTAPCGQTCF